TRAEGTSPRDGSATVPLRVSRHPQFEEGAATIHRGLSQVEESIKPPDRGQRKAQRGEDSASGSHPQRRSAARPCLRSGSAAALASRSCCPPPRPPPGGK
ncbi:hypothetical protein U0070_009733, partial [Myodes glareolus]